MIVTVFRIDMTFSLKQLPLELVSEAAAADARAAIAQLLQRPDANQLHGFAICTDPDVTSAYWTAETAAQLHRRGEELLARNKKADPNSALKLNAAIDACRFDACDWTINRNTELEIRLEYLNEAIANVWDIIDALPDSDEKILEDCPSASRAVLRAIGRGLLAVSESFDWSPGKARLSLVVWENDPDYPEVVREIVGLLNDSETFRKFCDHYRY